MNIIEEVDAMHISYTTGKETGINLIPWTLATIPEIPHWHDAFEICYCLDGKGVFYFIDRQYELEAGDVIVVNNVERHTSKSLRGSPCSCLFLFFNATTLEQLDFQLLRPFVCERKQFTHKIPASEPVAQQIGQLILQMERENQLKHLPAHGPFMKSLLFQICSLLLRHYADETSDAWHRSYAKHAIVHKALTYIHAHYDKPITLIDIARELALSPSRVRHLFVEVMGERLTSYVTHYRVQAAKRLLVQTDLTIEELYQKCGFQSASSFYREFQKRVRKTPLAYKKYPNETEPLR